MILAKSYRRYMKVEASSVETSPSLLLYDPFQRNDNNFSKIVDSVQKYFFVASAR